MSLRQMIGVEDFRQLKSHVVNIKRNLTLVAALPRFFREPITVRQAEEQIKWLLDTRIERFLEHSRLRIYERPQSPYLRLLKEAGCDFADLQAQVRRHGLEAALVALAREGVYLTSDELKGKRPVVRGRESFWVCSKDFEQRASAVGYTIQSSGTRNAPVRTFSSLEWRTVQLMGYCIFHAAHDLFSSIHAVYEPVLAGRVEYPLYNAKLGLRTERWFAPRIQSHVWLEDKYHHLNASLVAMIGSWFGPGIARPQFLAEGDVQPIVQWLLQRIGQGKKCCIRTVFSNAVRIVRAAIDMGVYLRGTKFRSGGEPLTESKRRLIEQVGAQVVPGYGFGGGLGSALGCGNPGFIDEMHVPQHMLAVVDHPNPLDYEGPAIHPLLITTLHDSAPRLLLNVENGDYVTMITRDCGCALQKVGFTQHLHTIRSFEKFTSEGMNYFGTDLFELLEHLLPSAFGGGPGDYQLVEEEDGGQSRLTLLVHPQVGTLDEQEVLAKLQEGLAQGSRDHRFMAGVWQAAGTLRVRREVPRASIHGKILPFRIDR